MVAVISCEKDRQRGCHAAIRETWLNGRASPAHVFFVGAGKCEAALAADEIAFDVPDDYANHHQKANAILEWAQRHNYSAVFMCDVDTYVRLPDVIDVCSGYEYIGYRCDEGHAAGGHGIWLGSTAMHWLVLHPCPGGHFDLYAGLLLANKGIHIHHNSFFLGQMPKPGETFLTAHLGRGTGNYDPQWMRDCHANNT
jgi:hypothetical protein